MQVETPPAEKPYEKAEGERRGFVIVNTSDGFSWKSQDLEHSAQLARAGWQKAKSAILSGDFFMVVHVVFKGRRCPPEIVELADTVTEMLKVKHAFNAGIPVQRGIED